MEDISKIYRFAQTYSDIINQIQSLESILWGRSPSYQESSFQANTRPTEQIGTNEQAHIERLDSRFQPVVRKFLQVAYAHGLPVTITDSFRSYEKQQQLFDQGRVTKGNIVTKAKPGQSLHNYGLAIDIAKKEPNGKISYDWKENEYNKIVEIAKSLGMRWGGDFQGFEDKPHFEFVSLRDILSGRFIPEKVDKSV